MKILLIIKTDFKHMIREPMMALLFALPLFIGIVFMLLLRFLVPFLLVEFSFNFAPYTYYLLSMVLILVPGLLGMVMGFLMLGDKDANIVELMRVTPLGESGYMLLRLAFIFVFSFIYIYYTYWVLGLYLIPIFTLTYIALLLAIYGCIMGLMLFVLADDKVKGLTMAKGLNILSMFALVDLVDRQWLNIFSMLFPPYWITKIITNPSDIFILFMGGFVHIIWFVIIIIITKQKNKIS